MEKLNIDQVAKLAHVSRSVVSRVLNNHPNVSDSARERVLEVVKKYNYRPNSIARSLATKNTYEIGIVTTRRGDEALGNGFWTLLHLGIFEECARKGYFVRLSFIGSEMQDDLHHFILNEHSIDGLILLTQEVTDLVVDVIESKGIPAVLVGHDENHPNLNSVDIDNFKGAYMATEHFIRLGHTRIAGLFGEKRMLESQQRYNGFMDALLAYDVDPEQTCVMNGDYSLNTGFVTMNRLIETEIGITAVFCASDTLAMGALLALHKKNLRVPKDIAVVGFDDLPLAQYTIPPLTTIRQPIYDKGKRAAQLLIKQITNKKERKIINESMKPVLIIRESCGGDSQNSSFNTSESDLKTQDSGL